MVVAGAVRDYTSVPFWDMWDGYLGFFRRLSGGENTLWWAQHNEHRIVLSRVVFWTDLFVFGGSGIFLLVVNFALAAVIATIFSLLLIVRTTAVSRSTRVGLSLCLAAILFSGAQAENFRWGFQSQFFLAQLLPLTAFLTLHRAACEPPTRRTFLIACLLGALSAGTMANGLLALPLMTVQGLVARMNVRRIASLAALSVAVPLLYFNGYETPQEHASVVVELMRHLSSGVAYVLVYLGGPWAWLLGSHFDGPGVAIVAGAVFCSLALVMLLRVARDARDGLALPLAIFLVFVVATATATAGGRLSFGLDQALSSRYATPVLMAWATLAVLYAPAMAAFQVRRRVLGHCVLIAFAGLMLVRHWKAIPYGVADPASQRLAALTLLLQIHDDEPLLVTYPKPEVVRREARWAERQGLALFGDQSLLDAKARLGLVAATQATHCDGTIRSIERVAGERRYLRIAGSIGQRRSWSSSPFLSIVDRDRRVVGIAVSGFDPVQDGAGAATSPTDGFTGYVLAEASELALIVPYGACETGRLTAPPVRQRVVAEPAK